jgi:hypothetical protein
MGGLNWLQTAGYLIAFATAMVVIALDCNSELEKKTRRLPISVLRSPQIWVLSVLCGCLSAICFGFSSSPVVTQIIELKWTFPPGRGLLVGVGVLAILRSKFFNFKDTDFGGEFFYNAARAWALNGLLQRWLLVKTRFTPDAALTAACEAQDFETQLVDAVREYIELQSDDLKNWFADQLASVRASRPPAGTPCARSLTYYRILVKLALDTAGPKVLSEFPFFPRS